MALSSTVPKEALKVKGMGQLGLNQRINKLRKTHGVKDQFSGDDTESIIRRSEIVRAQLVHAVSSPVSSVVTEETETEDRKKAREILQAKLVCASAFEILLVSKKPTSLTPPNTDQALCPTPLTVCFAHENDNTNWQWQKESNEVEVEVEVEVEIEIESNSSNSSKSKYDGRMHSYPYKKNGPYTCPKCGHVFETSQRFAAHVSSSHYKYESNSERKKRLMAKIRRRNLRIEWVRDGLTVVPDEVPSNATAFAYAKNNNSIKVQGHTGLDDLKLAPPPGWEQITATATATAGSVKIKLEPLHT